MKLQLESGKLQQQFCRGSAWEELQLLLYVSWFIWDGILPSWVIVVCEKEKHFQWITLWVRNRSWHCAKEGSDGENIHISPPRVARMHTSTSIVPWAKVTSPVVPQMTWPPILPSTGVLYACIHKPKVTGQTLNLYSHDQQPFSAKISTGFLKESGCKHCLYWALHSYNFILSPLRRRTAIIRLLSPVKPGLLRPKQAKWVTSSNKKDNLGFVSPSGVRGIKPSLTFEGYIIYQTCLSRRITFGTANFLYLRLRKVVPLSSLSPESFLFVNRG